MPSHLDKFHLYQNFLLYNYNPLAHSRGFDFGFFFREAWNILIPFSPRSIFWCSPIFPLEFCFLFCSSEGDHAIWRLSKTSNPTPLNPRLLVPWPFSYLPYFLIFSSPLTFAILSSFCIFKLSFTILGSRNVPSSNFPLEASLAPSEPIFLSKWFFLSLKKFQCCFLFRGLQRSWPACIQPADWRVPPSLTQWVLSFRYPVSHSTLARGLLLMLGKQALLLGKNWFYTSLKISSQQPDSLLDKPACGMKQVTKVSVGLRVRIKMIATELSWRGFFLKTNTHPAQIPTSHFRNHVTLHFFLSQQKTFLSFIPQPVCRFPPGKVVMIFANATHLTSKLFTLQYLHYKVNGSVIWPILFR